jgi:hypothetical protein
VVQKRRRWVDPNQLELPTPAAKSDARSADDSWRSRERIHAMRIVCVIVLCAPGLLLVPQLLHLDVGPVREAFGLVLASFSPLITLIASFYFTRSKE